MTLAEPTLSIPESPSILQEPTVSVRNTQGDHSQSRTGECFLLTSVQSELGAATRDCRSHEPSSTFATHRSSDRSQQNQETHTPVIHERTNPAKKKIAMETEVISALVVTQEINQERRKIQIPQTHDYLRPVDNDNMQGASINTDMRHGRAQTHERPQAKPRVKSLRRRETGNVFQCKHSTFTGTPSSLQTPTESNPLHDRETAQHRASANPAEQSNHVTPKTHGQQHGYQNEISTATPYQNSLRPPDGIKSPYTSVLSNTNWEVSRDKLSLFERIGGGSFGQVWKGAVFDVAGDKEWSVVAVKMLKGNLSSTESLINFYLT